MIVNHQQQQQSINHELTTIQDAMNNHCAQLRRIIASVFTKENEVHEKMEEIKTQTDAVKAQELALNYRVREFELREKEIEDINARNQEKIFLNVGGKVFETTRSTLCSEKRSMLASMFSGRHRLEADANGYYFIDRDPKTFLFILNHLRGHKLELPEHYTSFHAQLLDDFDYFCIPPPPPLASAVLYSKHGKSKGIVYPRNFFPSKVIPIKLGMGNPQFVALHPNGSIIVSLNSKQIAMYDFHGNFIKSFGSEGDKDGEFRDAYGIAVDNNSGNIVVTDIQAHHVQVFDAQGIFLRKFGSEGIEDGQFKLPIGVAVDSHTGNIIVADTNNHRIQVFDSKGTFLRKFVSLRLAYFFCPFGISVMSDGKIVLTDVVNSCVKVFDSSGTLVHKFGTKGEGDGQFLQPRCVAVDDNDNIVICDEKNHRIQIFDSHGAFLTKYGTRGNGNGQFLHPNGIAVGFGGKIVVADYGSSRLQIIG